MSKVKQQSETSDTGLSPKLEAHQADLEEILLKNSIFGNSVWFAHLQWRW